MVHLTWANTYFYGLVESESLVHVASLATKFYKFDFHPLEIITYLD